MQDSLPAGGLRLYREGVEPSGSLRKVSGYITILLSRTCPVARAVHCQFLHEGWRANRGIAPKYWPQEGWPLTHSSFWIRQLRVLRRGVAVYDQNFHPGVN